MNLTDYIARMEELGIDRGALAANFREPSTLQTYKDEATDWHKTEKVTPPPITEDLSHLVNRTVGQILGANGLTLPLLAMRIRRPEKTTRYALRDEQMTCVRQLIAPHLTTWQKKAFGWKV